VSPTSSPICQRYCAAAGAHHQLCRGDLFHLIDRYLRTNIGNIDPRRRSALAEFDISERTFHRVFADRDTTFERHVLQLRVELFKDLLRQASLAERFDRRARASMRLRRCRPCHAHVQGQIWRDATGLSRQHAGTAN
jgi:AraC-like DNA-binding protein